MKKRQREEKRKAVRLLCESHRRQNKEHPDETAAKREEQAKVRIERIKKRESRFAAWKEKRRLKKLAREERKKKALQSGLKIKEA